MGRRLAREKALQILFQIDVGKIRPEKALQYTLEEENLSKDVKDFATALVLGTLEHMEKVDKLIAQHSRDWPLYRIANVDRNILRLAVFELLCVPDIPHTVTINEAIELAKIFSGEGAGAFVNGILDQIWRHIQEEGKVQNTDGGQQ
ncbi:MAG TPA: transcription antitermination factor NusB [Clostridia bacterium]|nr:transcription antitermination factor NusB [Clostridia bacterium]